MGLAFEWDADKAELNRKKHGVSFEEARTVFLDPLGRLLDDLRHSDHEDRLVLFGRSVDGRLLAVCTSSEVP